jgi:periplasmic divalent cation tolerance protein
MSQGPALLWCPFPSEDEAKQVVGQLLDEELVGCANIIPGIISLYQWQGKRGEAREVGVLFKTDQALVPALIDRLDGLHSYDTPSITAWDADASSKATAEWLGSLLNNGAANEQD